MTSKTVSDWLPQVIIESILIVLSILIALGLDSWRENREDEEFVRTALSNFLTEIQQNKARLELDAAYNAGFRQVMNQHYLDGDIETVDEFVSMVGSYNPVALQTTAWDTALATGSLAKMDYNLVTALSQTYSQQDRYHTITSSGVSDLTSPQFLSEANLKLAVYNSTRFLNAATAIEEDLGATYVVASSVVQSALQKLDASSGDVQAEDLVEP